MDNERHGAKLIPGSSRSVQKSGQWMKPVEPAAKPLVKPVLKRPAQSGFQR